MEQSNAVALYRPLTPDTWTMIQSVAPVLHQARLFGVSSPEQAAAILLKGYELGLGLASSFEFVSIVEGKPAISPRGALALVMQSPFCAGIKIDDAKDDHGNPVACTVWMKRTNGFEYTVTWTMEDAKRAGVVKNGSGWQSYPANMLRWRAVGFCADVVFPDVIGGLKRADEFGADLTPEGDVIEGSWRDAPVTTPQAVSQSTTAVPPTDAAPHEAPVVAPAPEASLSDLVQQYGAEAVMQANAGRIPATDEEIAAVAQALGEGGGAA